MQALPDDEKRAQALHVGNLVANLHGGLVFLTFWCLGLSHAESWLVYDQRTSVEVSLHGFQGRS